MNSQKLDIEIRIEWKSRWHVGNGQSTSLVDRLLRKRSFSEHHLEQPYVPGSQIKGVVRHSCEKIVSTLAGNVVSPHVTTSHPDPRLLSEFKPLSNSTLIMDRLFGSRYQGECLYVEDSEPEVKKNPTTQIISRTAIDRVSGTTRFKSLFVSEVAVGSGNPHTAIIQARHEANILTQENNGFPYEYSLLLVGLLAVESLGGDKSSGMGRCAISIPEGTVHWNDHPRYPLAEALSSFTEPEWIDLMHMCREEKSA